MGAVVSFIATGVETVVTSCKQFCARATGSTLAALSWIWDRIRFWRELPLQEENPEAFQELAVLLSLLRINSERLLLDLEELLVLERSGQAHAVRQLQGDTRTLVSAIRGAEEALPGLTRAQARGAHAGLSAERDHIDQRLSQLLATGPSSPARASGSGSIFEDIITRSPSLGAEVLSETGSQVSEDSEEYGLVHPLE